MTYRKTPKVLARLKAKRALILACALDVVAKDGMDGVTHRAISKRARISQGGIARHYATIPDIKAAVVAMVLRQDLAAIRNAESLANAIETWGTIVIQEYRTRKHIGSMPAYRAGIRAELETWMQRASTHIMPAFAASLTVGGLLDWAARVHRLEKERIQDLLKAIGAEATDSVQRMVP